MRSTFLLYMVLVIGLSCNAEKQGSIDVAHLKCDYVKNPIGINNPNPKLSWKLISNERNQKQTAYQVLVSSDMKLLNKDAGDIWDTGKIESEQSVQIIYQGKKLESTKKYYWKVQVWNKHNVKSDWSLPFYWETGFLNLNDWKAKWIGYECERAPLFRKNIEINKPVTKARVYISGLGFYELSINGQKIGKQVLDPGQTDYEKRTFYAVHDVTKKLKIGKDVIGVMLGNGWYNQNVVNIERYGWGDVIYGDPKLLFQMHITFADGSEEWLISDETWKAFQGPVVNNNLYAGENYDARLEVDGWNLPGFNDQNWEYATLVDGPGGMLVSQNIPPIRKMDTITPIEITNPRSGIYIFDMGQNFAGWAKLKLEARKGTKIQMRFAECLDQNGMPDFRSTGVYATGAIQTDSYTCKGNGMESWEPRFTYHGFRYVELTGFPGIPTIDNLQGIVVHSSLKKTGEFECSYERFNRLHQTALWTEISNLHSIPTDCPHREKCGWLGDAFLTSEMTMYNFDAATFWTKFLMDIETSRRGGIPDNIAPGKRSGGKNPDWGAAFVQLTWNMFLYYGDKSLIRKHYGGLTQFMDHLQQSAIENIIYSGIGSLFSPGRISPKNTQKEFTSTLLYYFCADAMSQMAKAIDKIPESKNYLALTQQIKASFNNKFYNHSTKSYGGQEKDALALAFGLAPNNDKSVVAKNLNNNIVQKHNYHVATGIFGSRYIYDVLGKYGYDDTVKKLLHSNSFPSYGYLFSLGATTFWEHWGEKEFSDRPGVPGYERSKNHPFQGGFDAWFYNGIAGIKPDPENPGFKHIIFKPQLTNILEFARASYKSIYGIISSNWENSNEEFKWNVTIPVNTTATMFVPTSDINSVFENYIPVTESETIQFVSAEKKQVILKFGSGNYLFTVKKSKKF